MQVNVVFLILLLVLEKSGEIILERLLTKVWEWVLSDKNLKYLTTSFKLQILVLYLSWVLKKTPFDEPEEAGE